LIRLGLGQVPTQLPLKIEEETYCDGDYCSSEGNRRHSIIQSLNAHRIVILRVIIERMFCTVVEYVGLLFDILLTEKTMNWTSIILFVTVQTIGSFPRFFNRKEDVLTCCQSRVVSPRVLALGFVGTSANYSVCSRENPLRPRHCVC
jgi:hypothetical protein